MRSKIFSALVMMLLCVFSVNAKDAQWITVNSVEANDTNTWVAFRKDVKLSKVPQSVVAKIAADSKYWLWVNGELAVFEGGLKRGPNPNDTYYDEIDLAPYLKKGDNQVALLLWYFGREGFSHNSSGQSGVIVDAPSIGLRSDRSWVSQRMAAYGQARNPLPNYRLAESSIRYDANLADGEWQTTPVKQLKFAKSVELGKWGCAPWNALVKRPIPMWKDYGVKELRYRKKEDGDKVVITARLPYNMQFTPIIDIADADGGTLLRIETDHINGGSASCLYAEYVSRQGEQQYESLGWLNGEELCIVYPKNAKVDVKRLAYRETGYNCDFEGSFSCDNDFVNRFWEKAMRTLYVNMRDTYFDCPDRERAQWWGDVTILMGQSFYQLSPRANALIKKAMHELVDWQRTDNTLYSPVPEGNWQSELPAQMLASISTMGFWNYYMHTGDAETMKYVYPAMRRYLSVWELDDTGLTKFRYGGWSWGDWGEQIDIRMLLAAWHYDALQSAINAARLSGNDADVAGYEAIRKQIKKAFNDLWNGYAYRHPEYQGATDDRVQALAVVVGLADAEKYETITRLLQSQQYASPYMEKYVMEALFKMGKGELAMARMSKRFVNMVNDKNHTTLFEAWEIGSYGGGSTNHAWSGGSLTVMSQYLMGISPIEPGYGKFRVAPQPVALKRAAIAVPSVKGMIKSAYVLRDGQFVLDVTVPAGTEAEVVLPEVGLDKVKLNNETVAGKVHVLAAGEHSFVMTK